MRPLLLSVGLLAAATPTATARAAPAIPRACVYETPCVYVTPDIDPDQAPAGTVLTFRGRGWRPHGSVSAEYGSYCPRAETCARVGLRETFPADAHGRFVFRFRFGNRPIRGARGPVAAGSEEVRFSGLSRGGTGVGRFAAPPPPPSTPAQRLQAMRVKRAVAGLVKGIARAVPRTNRAAQTYDREIGRCQDLLRIDKPPFRNAVIERVTDAALEAVTYGVAAPEFRAYADELERLAASDPVLARGLEAWIAAIRAPRYVPRPGLCAVLRQWRDAGFARAAAPVDPRSPTFQDQVRKDPAIRAAGKRLRGLGVDRATQDLFEGEILGLENYIEI